MALRLGAQESSYNSEMGTVRFIASVENDDVVIVAISREALEDMAKISAANPQALVRIAEANRSRIEQVAQSKWIQGVRAEFGGILIKTADLNS